MRPYNIFTTIFTILILCLIPSFTIHSQTPTFDSPITALKVDGDRLLIGQGDTLVEARITPDDLQIVRRISLKRHQLRAFAVYQGITLALSEDGLTTLDNTGKVLDFAQGGGMRVAVSGGRVYIAALQAGIRVLQLDNAGKIKSLETLRTTGAALDLAPEASGLVWVAEGDQGIQLYDSNTHKIITWINNLAPAQVVRLNGVQLLVGYGSNLSVLNTINPTSPQVVSTVSLDGGTLTDLAISGKNLYVSRQGDKGTDAALISMEDSLSIVSQYGKTGAGDRLALKGDDLFIASAREGLRRVKFGTGEPTLVKAWPVQVAVANCAMTAPSAPEPSNGSEITPGEITLHWSSSCNANTYEVRINDVVVATSSETSYTFKPDSRAINWQVTAIDKNGNRADSPVWHFQTAVEGWLAAPIRMPESPLLYVPPPIRIDTTSPQSVLILTCGLLLGGLAFIVLVSWLLGRRYHSPYPKL